MFGRKVRKLTTSQSGQHLSFFLSLSSADQRRICHKRSLRTMGFLAQINRGQNRKKNLNYFFIVSAGLFIRRGEVSVRELELRRSEMEAADYGHVVFEFMMTA